MNSLRLLVDRRVRFAIGAAVLVLATVLTPIAASAEQLTERSIELSSSSVSAANVTYVVNFTAAGDAEAFVIDFCASSPVIGQTCSTPTGFSASGADSGTSGFTDVTAIDSNTLKVVGTINEDDEVTVALTGITNPSVAGPLYVRIVTYDTDLHADTYVSATSLGTGRVDDGGSAVSINNTIGVSGAVLESITFCVSGAAIDADCASTTTPVLQLGEDVGGGVIALAADALSTGNIYTQLSTNAVSGAVVSLKSSAIGCGGLVRAGAPSSCDILPALNLGVTAGTARFGVKTATATDSAGADVVGTLQPVPSTVYNNTTYALNYVAGDATGVTSTFGDPFLNTAGAPVNNKNMQLTFGASITNSTPAGLYSVDLGLIATGKF